MNKFQLKEETPIDILDIDNDVVRESQVTRLAQDPHDAATRPSASRR